VTEEEFSPSFNNPITAAFAAAAAQAPVVNPSLNWVEFLECCPRVINCSFSSAIRFRYISRMFGPKKQEKHRDKEWFIMLV
jgi:hypothetical protein